MRKNHGNEYNIKEIKSIGTATNESHCDHHQGGEGDKAKRKLNKWPIKSSAVKNL
jgi:hypothetical protein